MKVDVKKLLIANSILGIIILGTIICIFVSFNRYLRSPASEKKEIKYVFIDKGEEVKDIIKKLHKEKIIKKADWFYYYVILSGISKNIKAGMHKFSTHLTPEQVGKELVSSKTFPIRVTIPEGYTTKQIAEVLDEYGITKKEEFLKVCNDRKFIHSISIEAPSLEGFLFPDTYFFYYGEKTEDIIKTMINQFNKVYNKVAPENIDKYKILKIASIIEKEVSQDEEKPMVAAVIYNRLKKRMKLCMDSTLIYGLPNFDGDLKKEDLKQSIPYNTYLFYGLPPTPICNPGKKSLIAAIHPADVGYLYFVSKNDGTHIFSNNLGQQRIWVSKYQKKI
jgi:UPF0755 protein